MIDLRFFVFYRAFVPLKNIPIKLLHSNHSINLSIDGSLNESSIGSVIMTGSNGQTNANISLEDCLKIDSIRVNLNEMLAINQQEFNEFSAMNRRQFNEMFAINRRNFSSFIITSSIIQSLCKSSDSSMMIYVRLNESLTEDCSINDRLLIDSMSQSSIDSPPSLLDESGEFLRLLPLFAFALVVLLCLINFTRKKLGNRRRRREQRLIESSLLSEEPNLAQFAQQNFFEGADSSQFIEYHELFQAVSLIESPIDSIQSNQSSKASFSESDDDQPESPTPPSNQRDQSPVVKAAMNRSYQPSSIFSLDRSSIPTRILKPNQIRQTFVWRAGSAPRILASD